MRNSLKVAAFSILALLVLADAAQANVWTWNGWNYTVAEDDGSESYSSFSYDSDGRVSSVHRYKPTGTCSATYSLSYSGSAEPYSASATVTVGMACGALSISGVSRVSSSSSTSTGSDPANVQEKANSQQKVNSDVTRGTSLSLIHI